MVSINTIINRFPKFKGYQIFDVDDKIFLSAKKIRTYVNSFWENSWNGYEDIDPDWKSKSFDDKWEWFLDNYKDEIDPYVIIEIPKHQILGIYEPTVEEYIRMLNLVKEKYL